GVVLDRGCISFQGKAAEAIEHYLGFSVTSEEVTYSSRIDRPTITRVRIDPQAARQGNLAIQLVFESPFAFRAIPGFVIYSASETPVYGSNPRIHGSGYIAAATRRGVIDFSAMQLPIASGQYRLAVWLGDSVADHDHRANALAFEFVNPHQPSR